QEEPKFRVDGNYFWEIHCIPVPQKLVEVYTGASLMVNKKLATLLVSAVMLGQFGAVTSMLAQADTQLPVKTESPDSELRHVASVINNPTLGGSAELFGKASTPDIYMIGGGAGTLPTIVQVLPQDDDNTSLFVNGSEILRFH